MKYQNLYLVILSILISILTAVFPPMVTLAESGKTDKVGDELEVVKEEASKQNTDSRDSETQNNDQKPESEDQEDSESENKDEVDQVNKPTPEEIARLEKLATADKLYLVGDKTTAVKLYREAKEVWPIEQARTREKTRNPETFTDPNKLSPAGKIFWRNYNKGKEQHLETKVISSLKLLTIREPEFIPGHIHYAEILKKYEREEESLQVLNRAVNLYPNEPPLLRAKMNADIAADKWLDASIMARQFALFNPDSPRAEEFKQLATQYLAKYQSDLRSSITWNAVGNAIAGTVGFALTGNLFGPLSALETTSMLLQGESSVGETSVKQIKKQLPLLEDPLIVQYVEAIGQKIGAASGRDEFNYQFFLVMDDELNAFALPGGKVFVNAGAIMKTDSEAELAGLLAHEISHAALSHGFQLITKGNLTANIVSYIPYVGSTASSLIVLNYSRDMEKQADIFGTRVLVNAGYAADGIRNLMVKLNTSYQDKDNPESPAWLSSHPNSKQRVTYMEELIVDNNLDRYAYEGVSHHQEVKKLVTAKWQEYKKCAADVNTIKEAKKCAGEKESEKSNQENQEKQPSSEMTKDEVNGKVNHGEPKTETE